MVRTPGFHPGNPGSIPGEITKEIASICKIGAISLDESLAVLNPDCQLARRVRTASGSLQGNIPMQIIFAIVNFRGRGT